MNNFDLVIFDIIGTTVRDSDGSGPVVAACFRDAFSAEGISITDDEIEHQRGKRKKEAIGAILSMHGRDPILADTVYNRFRSFFRSRSVNLTEFDGVSEIFRILRSRKIIIGLESGLSGDLINDLLQIAGWKPEYFDFIISCEDLGKGRPDPYMIDQAAVQSGIKDRKRILKIGDTAVDIREGRNAGARTAAVLTGSQKKEEIEREGPDYIFSDIRELLSVI